MDAFTFTLNDINPYDDDLQIGAVDPVVIEDLYKRLNHDLVMNDGEQPQIDTELNVSGKVLYNYNEECSYYRYGMQISVDYQLFESLCGGVFTTTIGSRPCAELAITISDAIKYGMVKRTENPDVFEILHHYVVDRDYYNLRGRNVEMLIHIYEGSGMIWGSEYLPHYFGVWVEIIPDHVMIKNATKV